jgi:phage terminase large subunit
MKPRLQLVGVPKPQIFFTTNCKETILEFEQYKYAEAKKDRPVNEEPIKKYDNHPDGLRYLALHLKYTLAHQDTAPVRKLDFGEFGVMPNF